MEVKLVNTEGQDLGEVRNVNYISIKITMLSFRSFGMKILFRQLTDIEKGGKIITKVRAQCHTSSERRFSIMLACRVKSKV